MTELWKALIAAGAPAPREDMGVPAGSFALLAQRLHEAKTPPADAVRKDASFNVIGIRHRS